jgi:pimeloyl-ACP methyl ester carboxylesterase
VAIPRSKLTALAGSAVVKGSFTHAGHRLAYEVHGRGDRVVVLLHAILLDATVNRGLAESIAARGYRVVLLDLLGHGLSDKPRQATAYRMDLYAGQVVALLDELGVAAAVVGGVSLGAGMALQVAVSAPERVRGLLVEMPVLESAAPAAAMFFVPTLLAVRYLRPVLGLSTSIFSHVPRPGVGLLDGLLGLLSVEPDEMAAVLHGVLLGPIAPTVEERAAISVPALVIGHRADPLHPFKDAEDLAGQLPCAQLLPASSIAELRLSPERLTARIITFLDAVWTPARPAASGRRRRADRGREARPKPARLDRTRSSRS